MKMKRVLNYLTVVFFATLLCVSCIPSYEYSHTVTVTANFEYTGLKFDSDSLFFKSDDGCGINWSPFRFNHKVDTVNWVFEGGAILSSKMGHLYNQTVVADLSADEDLMFGQNRYRVNLAKDTTQVNTYLVYYLNPEESQMPKHDVEFMIEENASAVASVCLVNNTTYVAHKIAETYQPGDRLILTASGYLKGVKTGEASIQLADFSAQKDSIVSSWTVFDLSKLGTFDAIDFSMQSTKEEVPSYFCLDYFMSSVTISSGN